MKHGPIALLDSETPVVCIAIDQKVSTTKVVSNIQEVRARGAQVIAIATDGNEDIQHHADDVIYVPRTPAFLQAVSPCSRCSCLRIELRGSRPNVDQPRTSRRPSRSSSRGARERLGSDTRPSAGF
jgi:glucosamine--fructose-6-phosphate aminotransferase (isomerizing)